jgi:hypothetical protein
MSDYQMFATRADAVAACKRMKGWPRPEPVEMVPDDDASQAWAICVDGADAAEAGRGRWLRDDGYVH